MCKRPISCDCEHIAPVTQTEGLVGPFSDEESDYSYSDSDWSYLSDTSEDEDWWDEPEPTSGHRSRHDNYVSALHCFFCSGRLSHLSTNEPNADDLRQANSRNANSSENNEELANVTANVPVERFEGFRRIGNNGENSRAQPQSTKKTEENGLKRTAIYWAKEMNITANNKKTDSFEGILRAIKINNKCTRVSRRDISLLEKYVPQLDKSYKCNQAVERFSQPTCTLVRFALFLDLNCPSAYDFVINNYNTPLPSRKGLSNWYLDELGRPGLARKSFDILQEMATHRRLTCTLKWYLVKVANCKVDYKYDKVMVHEVFPRTDDQPVQAFVFELTSIDEGWRIPVGFFYADSVREETHASFIRACLTQCYEAGVDVVAVTFNTASPAEHLGCRFEDLRNLKTTFKHPACDRDVAAWIDPHASFKSVYHTLKSQRVLSTSREESVRWDLIRILRKFATKFYIPYEEGFLARHFDTILEFHNHVSKVGLTSAVMSESIASALAVGRMLYRDWFGYTTPTEYFIKIFNRLYDILNSGPGPDSFGNKCFDLFDNLDEAKNYIVDLFCYAGNHLTKEDTYNLDDELNIPYYLEGTVISGFIGFLITIESFKYLFDTLVTKEKRMSSLFTSRLCRDQYKYVVLESWESMADHFENRYRELGHKNSLGHQLSAMLKLSLQKGSVNPFAVIKATSDRRAFDYDQPEECRPLRLSVTPREHETTIIMERYVRWLEQEMLVVERKYMVGYLAGWIAATYAKCLKCEECVDLLLSDKKLWFHKYIPRKEMKWVCLPSEGLFRVCWECERAIKGKRTAPRVREDVFTNLSVRSPWSARPERHHWTHATLLIHLIVDKYLAIRVANLFPRRDFGDLDRMYHLLERFSRLSSHLYGLDMESGN